MIHGLLNGAEQIKISKDENVTITSVEEQNRGSNIAFVIEKQTEESPAWSTRVEGVWADPRLENSDATHVDYMFDYWPEAGAIIVVGTAAVLLDFETGIELTREQLVFVEFSAATEVLELVYGRDRNILLVISTSRIVALGSDHRTLWRKDTEGVIREVEGIVDGKVAVLEYNRSDPTLPSVRRIIDLTSGADIV